MVPTTGILEYFLISSVYPINKWVFGLIVIGGAGIITVNDFKIDVGYFGIIIAVGAVLCGCSQQIMIRLIQTDNEASISELMASVLPWSGAILSVLAYSIDSQISGLYIHRYKWSTEAAKNLILSSALSIGVNLSQFLCLRELSALEFQVLGHLKTVSLILVSFFMFHETINTAKLLGIFITVAGLVGYGLVKTVKD
eukprot:jgi/Picre1/35301/NNA_002763.t1